MLIEDLVYYKTNAGFSRTYHGMDKPNHPYTNSIAPTGWWENYHDIMAVISTIIQFKTLIINLTVGGLEVQSTKSTLVNL